VHDLFKKHNRVHRVAVEFQDLWRNKEVWYMVVTEPLIDVALHGWTHNFYYKMPYDEIMTDFKKSLDYWEEYVTRGFGKDKVKPIKIHHPVWNKVSTELERACRDLGLEIDSRHGAEHPEVYGFHSWDCHYPERLQRLENALKQ
jgi:peptidoglycan/xylan/chitin deacetylase (PgdA/CDA1 family)